MTLDAVQYLLGAMSGGIVGFTLGLVGGGGSILAVPLMVYLVGVASPHVAIGTSALAVAANAASGLAQHARAGTVKWRCGFLYAGSGVVGALAGSTIGKAIDGQKLLFLFALLMLGVGVLMLRGRNNPGVEGAACNRHNAPKVLGYGLGTGGFSGFFGIGGGFLIVPGLIASTRMPILNADEARQIIFMKRSMRPGFAGIENELLFEEKTSLLFGDAKDTMGKLLNAVKAL